MTDESNVIQLFPGKCPQHLDQITLRWELEPNGKKFQVSMQSEAPLTQAGILPGLFRLGQILTGKIKE